MNVLEKIDEKCNHCEALKRMKETVGMCYCGRNTYQLHIHLIYSLPLPEESYIFYICKIVTNKGVLNVIIQFLVPNDFIWCRYRSHNFRFFTYFYDSRSNLP